jgi:hypothetical protein
VLRFDPGFPDAYLLLAHIHERQHDPNSVVADVENYFKVASNDELRGEALGLLHNAQQDLAGASASPK